MPPEIVNEESDARRRPCECQELEELLRTARQLADLIERACAGTSPSLRTRLARAHALSACDELEAEIDERRREALCTPVVNLTRR